MGQASSSVRSLISTELAKDVSILQTVFGQDKLRVETPGDDGGASTTQVLVHVEEKFAILLLQPTPTTIEDQGIRLPVTWVATKAFVDSTLKVAANNNNVISKEIIDGTETALIQLSASSLLLIPSNLVEDSKGRQAVAQHLQMRFLSSNASLLPSDTAAETDTGNKVAESDDVPPLGVGTIEPLSTATNDKSGESPQNQEEDSSKLQPSTQQSPDPNVDSSDERVPPAFPMLDVRLLQQGGSHDQPLPLNTIAAQDMETDLFKGKVLMLVRPPKPEDDPYWMDQVFSKRKRLFVLQLQGQFKQQPRGQVYVGGEITKPVRVGLLTRGVMGMLLRFLEGFVSTVVYSFGDKDGEENPRVVIPAHWAFNRVQRTPPGQAPPPLTAEPFEESEADRKRRAKSQTYDWNTTDTFSCTFFSMYFNFCDWKLVSLPIAGDLNLSTFWNDAALRIIMYENVGSKKRHLQAQNRYYFSMQMTHSPDEEDDEEEDAMESEIALSDRTRQLLDQQEALPPNSPSALMVHSESMLFSNFPPDSPPNVATTKVDEDEEEFYDAEELYEDTGEPLVDDSSFFSTESRGITLATIDATVPAWVEATNSKGTYSTFYAINVGKKTILRSKGGVENWLDKNRILRSKASKFVEYAFSSQLSPFERKRRMLGYVVSKRPALSEKDIPPGDSVRDTDFLKPPNGGGDTANSLLSAVVARALSDRQWVEEIATIEKDGVVSFRRTDKKRPGFHIGATSILAVNAPESENCPAFPGFSFLCVESFSRSIYLMFSTSAERDAWLSKLSNISEPSLSGSDPRLLNVDSPMEEFMHHSSMWECKKRRLFNCAMFSFRCQHGLPNNHPISLVQRALRLSIESFNDESLLKRHEFFKSAAALKSVECEGLSEEERLAFFLNLYHTMVMHAFLILGPPSTSLRFISLFKEVAYEVGDDIFSLAELEHGVLRSQMSNPANFLSRFVIPKTEYRFALTFADFRINFALNSGSQSCPAEILSYSTTQLEEQLDTAARLYLQKCSVVRHGPRDAIVTLPRVCQWFGQDFGKPEQLLAKIAPYLKKEDRSKLAFCWMPEKKSYDMNCITLRYNDFSFTCRALELWKA